MGDVIPCNSCGVALCQSMFSSSSTEKAPVRYNCIGVMLTARFISLANNKVLRWDLCKEEIWEIGRLGGRNVLSLCS